jgi:hypothetical protein
MWDQVEVAVERAAVNDRRQRELNAFTRYCVLRIERELDDVDGWRVSVMGSGKRTSAIVRARRRGAVIEACGSAGDLIDAIWIAMCRLEQRLREAPWSGSVDSVDLAG